MFSGILKISIRFVEIKKNRILRSCWSVFVLQPYCSMEQFYIIAGNVFTWIDEVPPQQVSLVPTVPTRWRLSLSKLKVMKRLSLIVVFFFVNCRFDSHVCWWCGRVVHSLINLWTSGVICLYYRCRSQQLAANHKRFLHYHQAVTTTAP